VPDQDVSEQDPRAALDRVVAAARAHLDAAAAAGGKPDDHDTWLAFVELNNASAGYDRALEEAYGEVTPWDVDEIDEDGEPVGAEAEEDTELEIPADAPLISVRERRDYLVIDEDAILAHAQELRQIRHAAGEESAGEPLDTISEAFAEILQAETMPLLENRALVQIAGAALVDELDEPLLVEDYPPPDQADQLFQAPGHRLASVYVHGLSEGSPPEPPTPIRGRPGR
jgi:hypothetical protein